ncbi:hypothetical protein ACQEVF_57345 [Nonomuraea polychroma]|uniref:hypothetical protein n=1 Tax=Nonomuraea polychroma TaxID=46176 RepID=UPI003D8C05FE
MSPIRTSSACAATTGPPAASPATSPPIRGIPNEVVGKKLRDGDLVDVARHFAITRRDPSYVDVTGRHDLIRVDQAHVTRALGGADQLHPLRHGL